MLKSSQSQYRRLSTFRDRREQHSGPGIALQGNIALALTMREFLLPACAGGLRFQELSFAGLLIEPSITCCLPARLPACLPACLPAFPSASMRVAERSPINKAQRAKGGGGAGVLKAESLSRLGSLLERKDQRYRDEMPLTQCHATLRAPRSKRSFFLAYALA
ncbi:hypothetical protein BDZ90DRAFT_118812 [Jaminaea rosea]|uniref:Uncharacterized protein n=1 Tax=Jaminaea rosea TaxID=1569628 RepID=A0A316UXN4_9BASI|nr:hypothetical protein BDZ90DRAFT_118812 [Jaminaea rosea]PWN29754.1 hypothetical protein BDZ90DRAFT_118812 [Jaminaea rosea]